MTRPGLCVACHEDAKALRRAIRVAEGRRRRGLQPDLTDVDVLKDKLQFAPCGCWKASTAMPAAAVYPPVPKPEPSRVERPPLPSPRLRLKPSGRPFRVPRKEVVERAVSAIVVPATRQPPRPSATSPACSSCGVRPAGKPRADGQIRRHRTEVDNPAAPWCTGGAA